MGEKKGEERERQHSREKRVLEKVKSPSANSQGRKHHSVCARVEKGVRGTVTAAKTGKGEAGWALERLGQIAFVRHYLRSMAKVLAFTLSEKVRQ